ncbi:GntR family transcriptional regulator [Amycolatopsis acidicola]|uniref:GntR family transcriptional regulator n=1 Tax=Amycolatopsis acidicola TaxID=2596893 RepID=A0A5N0VAF7_9PSEU|nr:GntR family transcriptional regulator [Amycolatopsis acidicola]KAA9162574.1 GntR family transcriptional regulator [Amycolatopsis acidicola]
MDTPLYTHVDPPPADRGIPQRERVYRLLREEVMNGRFSPRQRLGEVALAERFGASRTPVREALARLLSDGLIERRDHGFFVTVPNLRELRDLYELRVTLELRGIARAIEDPGLRHDAEILSAELEHWYRMRQAPPEPDPQFVVLDEQFHAALSRSSGNPALTETLVGVNQRIRRVRMYDFLTADRISSTITEHIQIAELVLDGELEPALRALHEHVGESMAVVLERAQRAWSAMSLHSGAF